MHRAFLSVVTLAILASFTFAARKSQDAASVGSDQRARDLVRLLELHVLPKESGYLGIIGASAQKVMVNGRSLAVQSQNYYMLTRDRPIDMPRR